jgi:hypothetical protein
MRRDKPWFGPTRWTPSPWFWRPIVPVSWEGYAVTVALVLGMALLRLEGDATRRSIAIVLLAAAFCAIVVLTWSDPDAEVSRSWSETLRSWRTLVSLALMLAFAAAFVAAVFVAVSYGCGVCGRMPVPGIHSGVRPLR